MGYDLLINDQNANEDVFYSFHSLKKQWMTMIIINCNEKHVYDVASVKIIAASKSTPTSKEYLSLNELNYKYIFLWLAIIYISLFSMFFVHLVRYRFFNILMQCLLICYPFLQCILCIISHFYWNYSSFHGYPSNDYLVFC